MIYGVRPYLRTVSPLSLEGALEAREFIRVRLHNQELFQIIVNVKVDDMLYQITATSFNEDLADYILEYGAAL